MSNSRANHFSFLADEIQHFTSIENLVDGYSLDPKLLELVKLRVSQINGCSFCVSYHTQQLRRMNESADRIDLVAVWHEAPCFDETEKAAFRWADCVTRLPDVPGISDEIYTATEKVFGEEGICQLTLAVVMINSWNRLAVPFQTDHKFIADLLKPMTTEHTSGAPG